LEINKNLKYDVNLFKLFLDSYYSIEYKPSQYWKSYVDQIINVLKKDHLDQFGSDYFLTKGFGDAIKYTPKKKLRKILRIPFLYKIAEKKLALYRYGKAKKIIFSKAKKFITDENLVNKICDSLDSTTRNLRIERFVYAYNKKIPWRYLMFVLYYELLLKILNNNKIKYDIKSLINGNFMDIGGGYGSVADGIYILKSMLGIGKGTANQVLEQFPVSFIANQYLSYRHPNKLFSPLLKTDDYKKNKSKDEASFFQVIQSNVSSNLKNQNITLYFNSNSFQEMDLSQVKNYVQMIKTNKATLSFLACYFYYSDKNNNSPQKVINILSREFHLLGFEEYENKEGGFVPGRLYLYKI
tara:strand:- start:335 stop:1396 length:1062 start_codon:yes stop_codon:yes gene_type:complete